MKSSFRHAPAPPRRFGRPSGRAAAALGLIAFLALLTGCGPEAGDGAAAIPAGSAAPSDASSGQLPAPPFPAPAATPAQPPPADAPRVVAVDPPDGATDVTPGRRTLSVTFDQPMDLEGWAWLREDAATAPRLVGEAGFDAAGRTNSTEAELEPGRTYVIWINSAEIQHFQGRNGLPAVPFRWTFSTRRGAALADLPGSAGLPPQTAAAPQIVRLDPPDGATGVDPTRASLRVTFDRPMAFAWSWVQEDPRTFPETLGEPTFEDEGRTNVLPVRLAPETTYIIWLNSRDFQMFRSTDGVALAPRRWTFTTAPAP